MSVLCNFCILLCSIVLLQTTSSTNLPAVRKPAPMIELKKRLSHKVGLKAIKDNIVIQKTAGRIVFGQRALPQQFPYVGAAVAYSADSKVEVCTCSLVTTSFVIYAAHCLDIEVVAAQYYFGSVDTLKFTQIRDASGVVTHPDFNSVPNTFVNDIAIGQLETPVTLDANVNLIKLPDPSSRGKSYEGQNLTPIGFGNDESGKMSQFLKFTTVVGQSTKTCNALFPNNPNLICAKSRGISGICPGDSGGPLVFQNTLIGINDLILASKPDAKNAAAVCFGATNAFVRVDLYLEWISQYISS